jgi:hypothetical protein
MVKCTSYSKRLVEKASFVGFSLVSLLTLTAFLGWAVLGTVSPVNAQPAAVQIAGIRYVTNYGVASTVTSLNPAISTGWSAAPTASTNLSTIFAESGPIKDCTVSGCPLRPYSSWKGATDSAVRYVRVDPVTLQPNGPYGYRTVYVSGNEWQTQYCTGLGCGGIVTVNLGVSSLPNTFAAAETSSFSNPVGSVTLSGNQYFASSGQGNVTSWCYSHTVNNTVTGSISPCSNNSWSINY